MPTQTKLLKGMKCGSLGADGTAFGGIVVAIALLTHPGRTRMRLLGMVCQSSSSVSSS
jgi:hypothetical protein